MKNPDVMTREVAAGWNPAIRDRSPAEFVPVSLVEKTQ
jgi:hypothetical protein